MELWKSWSSRCICKAVGEKRGGEWNQSAAKLWDALKCVCVREWVSVCVCVFQASGEPTPLSGLDWAHLSLSLPPLQLFSLSTSKASPIAPVSIIQIQQLQNLRLVPLRWAHVFCTALIVQCLCPRLLNRVTDSDCILPRYSQSKSWAASIDIPWPVVPRSDSCSPVFFCWSNSRLRHKRSSVNSHIR